MMERYRHTRTHARKGTPQEIVADCNAYSSRLKERPMPVRLHVSVGVMAAGTVSLEVVEAGGADQLVVKAQGSTLFGLVKREHRHVFKVGELERSRSTHTAFLRRSVRHLVKGHDEREEVLSRSLSLIHEREAVDITCATKEDCEMLGEWIDAKWSVAKLQRSFRGNPRIALALQGKNKTLDEKGLYDMIERGGGLDGPVEGEGIINGVDGAGFGVLPKLDDASRTKLEDDLLDGVHVTFHNLGLGGYISRSSPRRLRHDCQSESGKIFLEPSFEGDGDTITQKLADLQQVGGGPSAYGPTAALLRATHGNPAQRQAAVSLVFLETSMDFTCGELKDAVELVLYFSQVRGFTRAKPPRSSLLDAPTGDATVEMDRQIAEATRDLGTVGVAGGRRGGSRPGAHRSPPLDSKTAGAAGGAAAAIAALEERSSRRSDSPGTHKVLPPLGHKDILREKGGARGPSVSPTFSARFRTGIGAIGKDDPAQVSASSGFGVGLLESPIITAESTARREGWAAPPASSASASTKSAPKAVVLQRKWPAHQVHGAGKAPPSAAQFRSNPTPCPVHQPLAPGARERLFGTVSNYDEREDRGGRKVDAPLPDVRLGTRYTRPAASSAPAREPPTQASAIAASNGQAATGRRPSLPTRRGEGGARVPVGNTTAHHDTLKTTDTKEPELGIPEQRRKTWEPGHAASREPEKHGHHVLSRPLAPKVVDGPSRVNMRSNQRRGTVGDTPAVAAHAVHSPPRGSAGGTSPVAPHASLDNSARREGGHTSGRRPAFVKEACRGGGRDFTGDPGTNQADERSRGKTRSPLRRMDPLGSGGGPVKRNNGHPSVLPVPGISATSNKPSGAPPSYNVAKAAPASALESSNGTKAGLPHTDASKEDRLRRFGGTETATRTLPRSPVRSGGGSASGSGSGSGSRSPVDVSRPKASGTHDTAHRHHVSPGLVGVVGGGGVGVVGVGSPVVPKDVEDDDDWTTFKVKGVSGVDASADESGSGAVTGLSRGVDSSGHSGSPKKDRTRRRSGMKKFLHNGGDKLLNFASGGGRRKSGDRSEQGDGGDYGDRSAPVRSGRGHTLPSSAGDTSASGSGNDASARKKENGRLRFFSHSRATDGAVDNFITNFRTAPGTATDKPYP